MTTATDEKLMTLLEFIALTWELIQAETNNLELDGYMRGARDRVVAWWNFGRQFVITGLIAVLALNVAGFILGWIFDTGIFNAIVGLLIAPIILIIIAWWTPLAGVLGIASEIVHGQFKSALQGGVKWAEGWMKIALGILMWQLILSLFLSVAPYWNAPTRVPIIALSALLFVLTSYIWGGGTFYRQIIRFSVIAIFVLNTVFCFIPATAIAIGAWWIKTDTSMARKVERDGIIQMVFPNAEASTFGISPIELQKGIYPLSQGAGELSSWIEPQGSGRYWIDSPDGGFFILTPGGAKIPSSDVARWPKSGPFKVYALTDQKNSILHIE